jgi:membrane protease YdiL (CAAX protease family)
MDNTYLISIIITLVWASIALHFAKEKAFFFINYQKTANYPLFFLFGLIAFSLFLGIQLGFELIIPNCKWKDPISIITIALALWGFLELFPGVKKIVWGSETFISYRQSLYHLSFGFMTWLICYPLVMLIYQSISLFLVTFSGIPQVDQLAVDIMKGYLDTPYQFWAMAFIICTVVPVLEEILFRGFLQTQLKSMMGINYAIGMTSIIFALFHFVPSQGLYNIGIISALWILSLFLGFIYERQRSLLAPIGLHCAFNTISVMLIFYQ